MTNSANSAYEELIASNAMDTLYKLPLCPMHANPHIYTAYAARMLEANGDPSAATAIKMRYEGTLLAECEKASGLITTFPKGGTASHDDLYGGAYLSERFAGRAIDFLERTDGIYRDTEPSIYRFLFLKPALKAWAGFSVGIFSQIQFAAHCMFHLLTAKDGETSDHLMIWLAIPAMRKYQTSRTAIEVWASKWEKRGVTPKTVFTEHYLTEVPWFGKFARDEWRE